MPWPPAAVTSAAVSSIVSGRPGVAACPVVLRPEQYTVAPASPSMRAMPRPAPRVAPATTAIFPVSGFEEVICESPYWPLVQRLVSGDQEPHTSLSARLD